MEQMGFVHTVYRTRSGLRDEGDDGTFGAYADQEGGGRGWARTGHEKKTEHVIHSLDGVISERNSYGNDPADRSG